MHDDHSPNEFDGAPEAPLAANGARRSRLYRRLFREMIKLEINDRPLGRLRRRALVRFGRRIGLDDFEARLIIRAVEYECGHDSPAAMAETDSDLDRDLLAESESSVSFLDRNLLWPVAIASCILLLRLLR